MRCDLRPAGGGGGGIDYVDSWGVRPGYRAEMMAEGQRAILWVSGDGRHMARGIWGVGWVRGPVRDVEPDGGPPDSFWLSGNARRAVRLAVRVWIPVLDEPVTVAELRAAGVLDLEVQRIPQGSNPSWVSKEQLAVLEHLLPAWPAPL